MLDIRNFDRLKKVETPFYFYDIDLFKETVESIVRLSARYSIKVHYAVKANVEDRILNCLSAAGIGADCVTGNEVVCASEHGFAPSDIFLAGVGKTDKEIRTALETGIGCLNVESIPEMEAIERIASEMDVIAPVSFRVNPNIDPHTHKYITTGLEENKFGISAYEFDAAVEKVRSCPHLSFEGVQFHIGSQITDIDSVFSTESKCAREIVDYFEGCGLKVSHIDFGGGLGVDYESPDSHLVPEFERWFKALRTYFPMDCGYELHVEPGRALVAQCASLIARVVFVKNGRTKDFAILDAGMNDLIRPALYGAYHKVENLTAYYDRGDMDESREYDVVGPVCESSDVWGSGRKLQKTGRGDLIAIRTAGAYGRVMASRYNLHDLAPAYFSDEI